ncbi:MAG: hypothetical protein ACI8ZM_002418 [Crocinitomix sp.]|jgi:hypothetical protein
MKSLKYITVIVLFSTLLVGCIRCYETPSNCLLTPDAGPCEASIERYYYNQETGDCEMFYWGGCQGFVPFETLEECEICVENK